jgi:hypothetical protein
VASSARWSTDPNVTIKAILAQPAYHVARTNDKAPPPSLWDQFWGWVGDHLGWLLHPLVHVLAGSSKAGTVIGVALTIVALLALAYVVFRFAVALARGPRDVRTSARIRPLQTRLSAAEARAAAAAAAARGDYARAIAALFAAALAELDERAVVAFDATRTPGEYRRLVRVARARAAVPFDELSERFVRAAFGDVPVGRSDFEAAERAFAAFEPAAFAG